MSRPGFWPGCAGPRPAGWSASFLGHVQKLLAAAPVLHAGETPGRAAGALSCGHVACTEYLTVMHTGHRWAATIGEGGVLAEYSGVLVRDGYAGHTRLPAIHAWCAAHLLRDLRSISDADPDHQQWALALAGVLLDAHHAATAARAAGAEALDPARTRGHPQPLPGRAGPRQRRKPSPAHRTRRQGRHPDHPVPPL